MNYLDMRLDGYTTGSDTALSRPNIECLCPIRAAMLATVIVKIVVNCI
jgi:hypothetical protein